MESIEHLAAAYDRWHAEAERLAGGLHDLAQRSTVYHHLFAASGRNHVFPLIAAHGALWARGYFQFGMRLGAWLSLPAIVEPGRRARLLQSLQQFADAFREVNRRVCVDTYTTFHFTALYGDHPSAESFVPANQLAALARIHHARRRGVELPDDEKRDVFEAFFRNEQATVVGPSVTAATESFDWPLLKLIALRPVIRFAYFPRGERLWFRNFADRDNRIANGLRAFEIATEVGWDTVEARLRDYAILPDAFFTANGVNFEQLRTRVLTA
ncbi:MAG: hypothetical protein JNM18_19520 [Planctomycetaceae bacterium]|nr:hypothetical protein [Planctomycetaceae bacterium]